jgi:peptidoglycan/xylan/chitin deacetylase (PgdA/CDA1 family)
LPTAQTTTAFPILMYHALWPAEDRAETLARIWDADAQMRDPGARLYALDERVFADQVERIARVMPVGGGWNELDNPTAPRRAWITFDDGHRSNHALALPILRRFDCRAIFFITTDWIGTDGFMNENELRDLRNAGMMIGTHGCSHRYLSDLSESEVSRELSESKTKLEGILGEPVISVSLPGGRSHPSIRRLAGELGYRHVFTSRMALARPGEDRLDWPRIAITNRRPESFLSELLAGQTAQLDAMARKARLRQTVRNLLGTRLYDRVRSLIIGKG